MKLNVNLPQTPYDIVIEKGILVCMLKKLSLALRTLALK